MALGSKGGYERNSVASSSPSLTKRQQLTRTLTLPSRHALPLPTLPFELIEEILSRLPVKLLLQLRCECKSWNSLISNTKFQKKHLSLSTTHNLHFVSYSHKYILKSYPINSDNTNVTTNDIVQPYSPSVVSSYFFASCNGILCLGAYYEDSVPVRVQLWNPSIRKFKELPPLGYQKPFGNIMMMHGFGYDPVNDNYKVVVVLSQYFFSSRDLVPKKKDEVNVHNLSTNLWKSIPVYPFVVFPIQQSGQCVSGTINWLASKDNKKTQCFILSLHLGKESFQEVLLPNYGEVDACNLQLSVLRDCLIMFSGGDVWVMKEYGNKESWTKLFTISYMKAFIKAIYIFENEQVLLKSKEHWKDNYIFFNCRNRTSKLITFEDSPGVCVESLILTTFEDSPGVCVESLISPCS